MLQRALHTRSDAGVRLLSVTVAPRRSNRRTRASNSEARGPIRSRQRIRHFLVTIKMAEQNARARRPIGFGMIPGIRRARGRPAFDSHARLIADPRLHFLSALWYLDK